MKKILKQKNNFLCMALICCMLVTAFMPFGTLKVHAASESQAVAKVGNTEYKNYQQAWDAVKNGGTITMLSDWHTTGILTVEKNVYITVNMNGYMINRGLTNDEDSGAIFLIREKGLLVLNGNGINSTEYWGTVRDSKWNYQENGKGTVKINGSLLSGGYNEDGGGAIHIQEDAEVRIDGVTIAGNACSDDVGGAICLQGENSKLTLTNSTIAYNKSDDGSGAAIGVEGAGSLLKISNTKIHHNFVSYSEGDGGAIRINNGCVEIEKSMISFNEAGRHGGAVYVYNGNLFIDQDTVISNNVANKEGGAVYVDTNADEVKIEGYFIGNRAAEEGGAIYVNSSISENIGVRISNVEMIGNLANENGGGAVYVDSDDDISLSARVVMHGNTPDNLHIRDKGSIRENKLTAGSRIGIFTSWNAAEDDAPVETDNYQYFFSDKIGYEVTGGSGKLYFVKGSEGVPSTYKVGNSEYEIIKSAFSYPAVTGGTMNPYFYYSDGYFSEDPKYYNEHCSSFAASMALAAMPAAYEGEYTEDKAAKYIVDMFVAMGYSDIFLDYPAPEYFGKDAENLSTIGYAIAKKTIVVNGEETTVIATALRGGGYGVEWVSNVILGSGLGEAKGFGDAARTVAQGIDAYVTQKGIDTDSAKFFITGYSRAGAISNLVAKKLTDIYGEDQVYAYCFETPKGGVFAELKDSLTYTNIHNIINGADIITTAGTEQMGFIRYGVDHIVPNIKVGSDAYNAQKVLMLAQLSAVNEHIVHNDYFHEATVEYVLYKLGMKELIGEIRNSDFDHAEDWIPYFIEKLQEYSFTDMADKADTENRENIFNNESDNWYGYRNFYADYEWYLYFDEADENKIKIMSYATKPDDFDSGRYTVLSFEDAIENLMLFYFGSSNEKKEAIVNSLDVDAIMDKIDMWNIYTVIIDEWNGLSIDDKNKEFNILWQSLDLEKSLKSVLTAEELKTLMTSFYVVADFLLDFVADDYDETNQNVLGTLVYNIGNILQTHYRDVAYSWVRSYDSFYSDIKYVCKHIYGKWTIVKEASAEDYGVRMKTCERCNDCIYEEFSKIVIEDNEHATSEKDTSEFRTPLFEEGSVVVIVFASVAMIAVGGAIHFYFKIKKESFASKKDDE